MLADRLHKDFDAGNLDRLHLLAHLDAAFGAGPAGAAIGDEPLVVDGAEVASDGDIARADLEVDAERFQDAAADLVFERVIAEQAEMARAAAGGDAGEDRDRQTADPFADHRIEVGGACGFEFGLAAELHGEAAESVCND